MLLRQPPDQEPPTADLVELGASDLGRGLAQAMICVAVERLRGDQCDSIFVVADDKGTVKDLYRRLGFDDVRRTWSFWWPGP